MMGPLRGMLGERPCLPSLASHHRQNVLPRDVRRRWRGTVPDINGDERAVLRKRTTPLPFRDAHSRRSGFGSLDTEVGTRKDSACVTTLSAGRAGGPRSYQSLCDEQERARRTLRGAARERARERRPVGAGALPRLRQSPATCGCPRARGSSARWPAQRTGGRGGKDRLPQPQRPPDNHAGLRWLGAEPTGDRFAAKGRYGRCQAAVSHWLLMINVSRM